MELVVRTHPETVFITAHNVRDDMWCTFQLTGLSPIESQLSVVSFTWRLKVVNRLQLLRPHLVYCVEVTWRDDNRITVFIISQALLVGPVFTIDAPQHSDGPKRLMTKRRGFCV